MPEKNSSFTVEELTGEALIRSDGAQVDERTRIAALLDALRKLAVKVDSPASIDLKSSEILEKSGAVWDGLEVSSEIIRKKGVVISDEIRVILHDKDMKPVNSWRTRNMKLIEPAEDREAGLSILMAAMQARGFKFESNHRLEENIWQEVIRYSKFDNK